ncbi:hypothetical protein GUITHDRAFT_119987 [Guillardia theta CCMP2712]|uniref:Uncharacterized protein n=1 Tax=Guillardia theta (strain CCMP2712) TaxID=905079 RepID=L1IC56_GUITC|nr:hypothetical protein GUITHDRAFT_119987 [Guillardia theta CCMP2712]EKX33816.1 hypothetical protein GUITHDRAFT_119987 [Guillardia theta CCMP2712]|eukprot:XP_005820796.1 hypothetical protein GUITHDRAFT_119987 [Guillardia theta CCMP2712]
MKLRGNVEMSPSLDQTRRFLRSTLADINVLAHGVRHVLKELAECRDEHSRVMDLKLVSDLQVLIEERKAVKEAMLSSRTHSDPREGLAESDETSETRASTSEETESGSSEDGADEVSVVDSDIRFIRQVAAEDYVQESKAAARSRSSHRGSNQGNIARQQVTRQHTTRSIVSRKTQHRVRLPSRLNEVVSQDMTQKLSSSTFWRSVASKRWADRHATMSREKQLAMIGRISISPAALARQPMNEDPKGSRQASRGAAAENLQEKKESHSLAADKHASTGQGGRTEGEAEAAGAGDRRGGVFAVTDADKAGKGNESNDVSDPKLKIQQEERARADSFKNFVEMLEEGMDD